ncbi:DUF6262 family protein [Streptomyces nigrescens]|uniref:DUF6262 family protein n=1 Tax=Streptomyces nigrescens TaxID=1920 RepID=UPI00346A4D41
MTSAANSTAAAIAARRRQTRGKLTQLEKAITQLRRERGRLNVRAIAERAGVSATFCYENTNARALIQAAVADARHGVIKEPSRNTSASKPPGASAHSTPRRPSPAPRRPSSPSARGSVNSWASSETSNRQPPRTPPRPDAGLHR